MRVLTFALVAMDSPPSWVVVQGDTTSALAGALTAGKLGIPVYHVEAGSRSGDRSQPEELNRLLIDRIATGHACAYLHDQANLLNEGIADSLWSGEILIDTIHDQCACATGQNILATIHRAETLGDRNALAGVLHFLAMLSAQVAPVTLFCHPHTRQAISEHYLWGAAGKVTFEEPQPPNVFRWALRGAAGFVTDSGGAAVESAWFGVPTVIARETTELQDLVDCGRLVVGGRTAASLQKAWNEATRDAPLSSEVKEAWHGHAAERIAEVLLG